MSALHHYLTRSYKHASPASPSCDSVSGYGWLRALNAALNAALAAWFMDLDAHLDGVKMCKDGFPEAKFYGCNEANVWCTGPRWSQGHTPRGVSWRVKGCVSL